MLPRSARLTDSDGFAAVVRRGRRAAARTVVVHALVESASPAPRDATPPLRVGFVVSKAVGPAVTRNRVKRRLRHQARELLPHSEALPGSAVLVVRALPPAAGATSLELRQDLARCLGRIQGLESLAEGMSS
ncbi:MAG: ribonuclease P protein component [Nocardioides sp.]|uniref:ribonuclease P protein component n=1 Tax=Nocardioides sp. TaxID=35761 RepID=UPI0039E21A5C